MRGAPQTDSENGFSRLQFRLAKTPSNWKTHPDPAIGKQLET
jgi:hypothetical protein